MTTSKFYAGITMRVYVYKVLRILLLMPLAFQGVGARAASSKDRFAVIISLGELENSTPSAATRKARRQAQILSLKTHAALSQKSLIRYLRTNGADKIRPLWINNAIACTLNSALLHEVMKRPDVKHVFPDEIVTLEAAPPSTQGTPSWNLAMIEAPSLWLAGQTGQGVVVASMDSGVDIEHVALSSRFRGGTNSWYDPAGEHPSVPYDSSGHGTQTMSLIVGGTLPVNGTPTAIGLAPGAQWMAVKIFDDRGESPISNIHAGFQWLLDPDGNPATDDAPDVVNNSWGYNALPDTCFTEFETDIIALRLADIAVVFAAGNLGPSPSTSMSPGNYAGSNSVGAIDQSQLIGSFSGRGPSACGGGTYPRFVAPGENVLAADRTLGGVFKEATAFVSGTSFATPHISGAFVLLRGAFPSATAAQIRQALVTTALDLGVAGADHSYGSGVIKMRAAYDALVSLLGDPVPVCQEDADLDGTPDCNDACPNDAAKVVAPCTLVTPPPAPTPTPTPVEPVSGSGPSATNDVVSPGCQQSSNTMPRADIILLFLVLSLLLRCARMPHSWRRNGH